MLCETTIETNTDGEFPLAVPAWSVSVLTKRGERRRGRVAANVGERHRAGQRDAFSDRRLSFTPGSGLDEPRQEWIQHHQQVSIRPLQEVLKKALGLLSLERQRVGWRCRRQQVGRCRPERLRQSIDEVDARCRTGAFQPPHVRFRNVSLTGKFCLCHSSGPPHLPQSRSEPVNDLGMFNSGLSSRHYLLPSRK